MAKRVRDNGSAQSMEEIMVSIHAWTEEWKAEQAGRSLAELVRIGLATRAETMDACTSPRPPTTRSAHTSTDRAVPSETQDLGLLGLEFEALDGGRVPSWQRRLWRRR